MRIKGCLGIGAKGNETLQLDYTAHHCCFQKIKKQSQETLIFIGYDLEMKALMSCIKEGDQIEKDS